MSEAFHGSMNLFVKLALPVLPGTVPSEAISSALESIGEHWRPFIFFAAVMHVCLVEV